jgi:hypothetical protein
MIDYKIHINRIKIIKIAFHNQKIGKSPRPQNKFKSGKCMDIMEIERMEWNGMEF